MGGPASPFLWNVSYDPIVWTVALAARAPMPTYVDDLAGEIRGPRQALRAYIALLVTGAVAGLRLEQHQCSLVQCTRLTDELVHVLRPFPVTFTLVEGAFYIIGLHPFFIAAIWRRLQDRTAGPLTITRSPCNCNIKTHIVPAWQIHMWDEALQAGPFLGCGVVPDARYLGARVAALAPGPGQRTGAWMARASPGSRLARGRLPSIR